MPHLSIRLLGPIQVTLAGEPVTNFVTDKVRALLAYLAVESDKAHRREYLAGLLWPEQPERSARANLRRALANLRMAIDDHRAEPPFLLITRQTVQLNRAGDIWVDVTAFAELLDADGTAGRCEEAVELYRGRFLEGFSVGDSPAFEEWALLEQQHHNRRALEALRRLADHHEAGAAYEEALRYAWRQVELDPWRESAHRQVMRLLASSGQRNAALVQYKTMRGTLDEELGIDPEAESTLLYEQIRSGELESAPSVRTLTGPPGREARSLGECPFRGLSAFGEEDAAFFYGRENFTGRLMDAMRHQPVVAVIVGPSGSGKSSTVFAGLLPRLHGETRWLVAHFRPGAEPFHAQAGALLDLLEPELNETDRMIEARRLADALSEGEVLLHNAIERILDKNLQASRMLLVVDQCEELYTLCPDSKVRNRFLDGLLEAVETGSRRHTSPLVVLVTLRADFMGHALTHRPFADVLQEGSLMMGPMSRDELRSAIEQPADKQGAAFEAGLVERLLDDVGEEPGNLPLLEFALTLLWHGQTDGWLTHAGYEEIGRVEGAVTRYADDVYGELDEHQQENARRVFEQLVRPGEGTDDTRRVATRSELGDENWSLIQHLADKRLVVTGRDTSGNETVEVVHEALIQRWGRLQAWMDADRAFRTWQEGLRAAMRGWEASDGDEGALLRGAPLVQAESWMVEREDELSETEQEFIRAGVALRERRYAEGERRRRRTFLALAGGLMVAIALTIVALNARAVAQREADANHSLVLAADAKGAFENGETDLALALALEAVDTSRPPSEAQRALSTIALGAGTRAVLEGHSSAVRDATLSFDDRLALSGSCAELGVDDVCTRGELILWDLENGTEKARLEGHTDWVNSVAFSPDGETALSGSGDATIILWDVATGEPIRTFEGHSSGVTTVAFSPDGTSALSGSEDATIILWDVATGKAIRAFEGHDGGITRITFSPNTPEDPGGQTALSASHDATMILWDVGTGEAIRRFEGHENTVADAAIHPDGDTILSIGRDLSLREWDLATGVETRRYEYPATPASVAIAPDGRTAILSVKVDLRRWDIQRWQESGRLAGHEGDADQVGDIDSITISSDGGLALSGGSDGTLRLWNLAGMNVSRRFETDGTPIEAVAVGSDGNRLLTGLGTGETVVWDVEQKAVIRRFGGEGYGVAPDCLAFSPAGPQGTGETSALVCAEDVGSDSGATSLVLWDLDTGREIRRFEGHTTYVRALAFSPDGRSALSGSQSLPDSAVGDLILWDLETGREIRRFDITHDVANIAMSADGSLALTGSVTDSVAILWDVATGSPIRRFEGHTRPVLNVAFGPQERTVLTASFDGTMILWDIETGEMVRRYLGHGSPVWGLDISPDGRYVISSSDRGTVILWDFESGKELRRMTAHSSLVFDVAFHPDGQSAFSVGADGELIQWQVTDPPLDELLEWIHANRYVRELTCEEREQYRVESSECRR